jgi:hypothetical protein
MKKLHEELNQRFVTEVPGIDGKLLGQFIVIDQPLDHIRSISHVVGQWNVVHPTLQSSTEVILKIIFLIEDHRT